jgi:predicted nucleic acid-binding Zn ribbon protein
VPVYVYEFIDTEETIEITHSIHDDALKEYPHPETGKIMSVKRIIAGIPAIHFHGGGWTATKKRRGYEGKFVDKVRPIGTPVDNPASKREADILFQNQVDNGLFDGVKPSFSVEPQTAEQMVDPKYKPKIL